MTATSFAVSILSILALAMPTATGAAASESCPIAKSIYRDGDGKGFELVFGPPTTGRIEHATAVINHRQQRQLYRFKMYQRSGYGSVWLSELSLGYPKQPARGFWITFFDRDLKSATPLFLGEEKESPRYAVIADLGSYDYYRRRGQETLIKDPIWVFDRCQ